MTICEVGGPIPAPQFYSQEKRGLERGRAVLPGEIPNSRGTRSMPEKRLNNWAERLSAPGWWVGAPAAPPPPAAGEGCLTRTSWGAVRNLGGLGPPPTVPVGSIFPWTPKKPTSTSDPHKVLHVKNSSGHSSPTSGYIHKRKLGHSYLCTSVRSSPIHGSQKVETTQMSINR